MTDDNKTVKKDGKDLFWIALGLIILLIGGIWFWNNYTSAQTTSENEYLDQPISLTPSAGVTTIDILNNPGFYQNQIVTVRGQANSWINERVFTLHAPGFENDSLLVITSKPDLVIDNYRDNSTDTIWEVDGKVKNLQLATDSVMLGLGNEANQLSSYEAKPFIVATSVLIFRK